MAQNTLEKVPLFQSLKKSELCIESSKVKKFIFIQGAEKAIKEASTVMENKSKVDRLYEQLVERFIKWAKTRSDIRAAVIVGSRARVDHPADELADLEGR